MPKIGTSAQISQELNRIEDMIAGEDFNQCAEAIEIAVSALTRTANRARIIGDEITERWCRTATEQMLESLKEKEDTSGERTNRYGTRSSEPGDKTLEEQANASDGRARRDSVPE